MKKPSQASIDLMLLAMEVERFEGGVNYYGFDEGRALEVKIALSQPQFFNGGPYYEGARDRIGMKLEDGIERLPGNEPEMLVPHYLIDTDHARRLQPKGWHASAIIQDRWEPHLWYVALRKPGRDGAADCKANSLAKAWASAALKAQSFEVA